MQDAVQQLADAQVPEAPELEQAAADPALSIQQALASAKLMVSIDPHRIQATSTDRTTEPLVHTIKQLCDTAALHGDNLLQSFALRVKLELFAAGDLGARA